MTTIEKLQIQGIRSFAPSNSKNVIEFYKPLTIIVGHNGAGKTTIIECLKYACTGEYPPNATNGQAFIHDTKIAGETEVKANVKLQFRTISNHPFLCVRQVCLTQMANRQSLKSLNTTLRTTDPKTGEKRSQTMKCTDMDKEIPELMGVSKAVLENVIFCHQEESNWPLSDNSKLKAKFDDIFSATRYTKAVDAVRKQQKAQSTELTKMKLELENFSLLFSEMCQVQDKIEAKKQKYQERKETEEKFKNQLEVFSEHLAGLSQRLQESQKVQERIGNWKKAIKSKEEECKRFLGTLADQYSEPKEQLENLLKEFHSQMKEIGERVKSSQQIVKALKAKEVKDDKNLQELIFSVARLEASSQKRQEQRSQLREQSIQVFHVYFPDEDGKSLYESGGPERILGRLEKHLSILEKDFAEVKLSNETKLSKLRKLLSEGMQRLAQWETKVNHLQKDLRLKRSSIHSLEATTSKEPQLKHSLGKLQESLSEKKVSLSEMQLNWDPSSLKQERQEIDDQIERMTVERNQLERDFIEITSQSQKRAALEHSHKRMKEKENELEGFFKANGSIFLDLFDVDLKTCENLPHVMRTTVEKLENEESECRKKLQQVRQKFGEYQGQLKSCKQAADGFASNLDAAIQQIQSVCEDYTSFPEVLERTEMELEDARKEINVKQSAELLYQEFLDYAKRKSACMVCERAFGGSSEAHQFQVKMREYIDGLPAATVEAQKKFEEVSAKAKDLQRLRGTWDRCHELENVTIPEQTSKYSNLRDRLKQIREKEEKIVVLVDSQKAKLEQARELQPIAQDVARVQMEIVKLSGEIEREGKKLEATSLDTRTSDEVRVAKEKIQKEIDLLSERKSKIQENYHRKERAISEASRDCQSLENKIRNASDELNRLQEDKKKMSETASQASQIEAEISSLNTNIASEKKGNLALNGKISEQERSSKENEALALKQKSEIEKKLLPLKSLLGDTKVQNLEEESKELSEIRGKQEFAKKSLDHTRREIEKHQLLLKESEQDLNNNDSICHNIENNIKYRELVEGLEKEEAEFKAFTIENKTVSQKIEELLQEQKEITENREKVKGKWDKCKGVRIQLRDDVINLQKELGHAKFNNVETNHRKKMIDVQITEMSVKDLEQYHKALDRALVKYHATKMAEINTTIKELWQSTYKGEDIDCIEIRSELPTKAGTGKRAYDYRVVMLKGEVEIDMRGRCSAGQKVLASLVIRLALAETFCVNCGILALDEPTTNLDRRNVESFANALVDIVASRRGQKHFQLIVITHDEEFVQLLGRSNNADYYWRVSKASGGSSILRRHEIADLS